MSDSFAATYRGVVVNNVDPQAEARVTLKIPDVLGSATSNWATPSIPTTNVPDPGELVWVLFEGGDPGRPIYHPRTLSATGGDESFYGSPPKPPSGITLTPSRVISADGVTTASLLVEWTAPTENQDGSIPIKKLTGYRVQYSYNGNDWLGGWFVDDTHLTINRLTPGTTVNVRVQSVSAVSGAGTWASTSVSTTDYADPSVPSTPTVTGRVNSVSIAWNGLSQTAEAMPADFDHVDVERSTSDAFSSVFRVGSLVGEGILTDNTTGTGTTFWYRLVAVSKSGARSGAGASDSAAGQVDPTASAAGTAAANAQSAADAAQSTANTALTSANGKNKVTYSDNAPGTTPNNPGDVWFQRGTDGATIVGQWEGTGGTTWAARTLSHETIASVDLGTATVGKMRADRLDAGVLSADFTITGGLMAGTAGGARVEYKDDGLSQYASDGSPRVRIPSAAEAPAVFEGDLVASSLTIQDRFALRGETNEISKGSAIALSGGTSAPTSPPSLQVTYEKYDGNITEYLMNTRMFHHDADGGSRWLMSTFFGLTTVHSPSGKYTFPQVTPAGQTNKYSTWDVLSGTVVYTSAGKRLVSAGYKNAEGQAAQYGWQSFDTSTLVPDGSVAPLWKASAYSPAGVTWGYWYSHNLGRCISAAATPTAYQADFAEVETNLLASQQTLKLRRWRVNGDTSITQQGSTLSVTAPWAGNGDVEAPRGVVFGSSARMSFPGTDQDIWLVFTAKKCYAFSTTGSRLTDFDFDMAPSAEFIDAAGSTDSGVNGFLGFRSAPGYQSGEGETRWITKYSNFHWSGSTSDKWWVSSTWFDPDAAGGTHETAQGPRAAITMPKRSSLLITVPPFPSRPVPTTTDDVLAAKIYLNRGATDPGQTKMEYVTTVTDPNRSYTVTSFTFPASTAATPPPAFSNFPASSPGRLTSGDGVGLVLSGDGSAYLQGSSFSATEATLTHASADVKMVGPGTSLVQVGQDGRVRLTGNNSYIHIDKGHITHGSSTSSSMWTIMQQRLHEDGSQMEARSWMNNLASGSAGWTMSLRKNGVEKSRLELNENALTVNWVGIKADSMRGKVFSWTDSSGIVDSSASPITLGARGGQGTFVAPPSGTVLIYADALTKATVDGGYCGVGAEVRTGSTIGSGTVVFAYARLDWGNNYNQEAANVNGVQLVTGLTPGATYNVQNIAQMGSSGGVAYRGKVAVLPQM